MAGNHLFFVLSYPHLCFPSLCISFECYPRVVCACITFLFTLPLSPSIFFQKPQLQWKSAETQRLCAWTGLLFFKKHKLFSWPQRSRTIWVLVDNKISITSPFPPSVQLWLTHMHSHLHGVIQACLSISRKTLAFSSQRTKASVCTLVQWMLTLANAFVFALENSCSSMCAG